MEKFEEIENNFRHIKNNFTQNVKDRVGSSIYNEQLEPLEKTIVQMKIIEEKVTIEVMNINRLLIEARTILPRI